MNVQTISRSHKRAPLETSLIDGISFTHGRVHEFCGAARHSFACRLAGRLTGPIIWIRPKWGGDRLAADGMAAHFNPARIVFADVRGEEDNQWCSEEALRASSCPLIISERPEASSFTQVRRLHLAAEASQKPALFLMLSPEEGGSQGVETRWHFAPTHQGEESRWNVTRLRARMQPVASWTVLESKAGLRAT